MLTLRNLIIFAFSTIVLKFTFLFIPNDVSSVLIKLLYTLNIIFLFSFLKANKNLSIATYPIILISFGTLFLIIDSFIPYQSIKANFQITESQSLLIYSIRYLTTTFPIFIGELTFVILLFKQSLQTSKKLGKYLTISLLLSTIIPIAFSFLPISLVDSFQYFNILYFLLGIMSLLIIGIYYTAQLQLSITQK